MNKIKNKLAPEDMIYKFVVFKLEGHNTWRMCDEKSFREIKNALEPKYILVDRITGKIELK